MTFHDRVVQHMEVITTHINADFDALASMLAAKLLYPDAVLVFPGATERNIRNFFVDSVVYAFDLQKMKNIDLDQVNRLILVDTRQKSRIGRFQEIIDKPGVEVHIYDHHPDSEDDIRIGEERLRKYGANTTQMVELVRERGLFIPPEVATIMALGIYEDTGSFTFVSTTEEDFKAAGYLLSQGANLNMIADMMHRELNGEQIGLLNELVQSAETVSVDGIDVVLAKVSMDNYVGDFAVLVHKFMDIENLNALFALAQMEDRVYIVGRSRIPEVSVSDILSSFGGGGHSTAASAAVKQKTLFQVEVELIRVLKAKIKPKRLAGDIMSYPVISVPPDMPLAEVAEVMTRYSINVALVIEGEKLLGHISHQVVEKAMYHGLRNLPASDYMNSEFSTVPLTASIEEIQEHLIMAKQRILPVMDNDRVAGVITRTDVLSLIMEEAPLQESSWDRRTDRAFSRTKQITSLMKERLPRKIIDLLKSFGDIADELGYNVYAVGGFIRDLLLRRPNTDIDIVVEGEGILFARRFAAKQTGVRIRTHEKFGTAVVIFPDGFKVDVATARREYYESPATLPIVELSSIKLDLYRRDFSINTLAVKLNRRNFGVIIDFFGAQKDLKDRAIRVLHNLSFVEDPTRVFRAIRFETRFGFKIGKLTDSLIRNAVKINVLERLAGRRLLGELKLLLEEEHPILGITRMNEFHLLEEIHPAITYTPQLVELFDDIVSVLSWFDLSFLEEGYRKWLICFLGLTEPLSGQEFESLCRRLEMTRKDMNDLVRSRGRIQEILKRCNVRQKIPLSEYYDIFHDQENETLLYLMSKTRNDEVKKAVSLYFTQLRSVEIETTGHDLMRMGYPQGPIYSTILRDLLHARLNGLVQSKSDEESYIRRTYPDPGAYARPLRCVHGVAEVREENEARS